MSLKLKNFSTKKAMLELQNYMGEYFKFFQIFGGLILAAIICWISIPSIVSVAKMKNLCEKPDERRLHKGVIPTMGGIGIFSGLLISMLIFCQGEQCHFIQIFAASAVMLFFIGVKDDILMIAPVTKLIGQIISSLILCVVGNVRITNLCGLFGINEIPYIVGIVLSVGLIIFVINAYNLIDGVDGLAGLLGITTTLFFSAWFYREGLYFMTALGACFIGAVIGFLRYNLFSEENKIFMGDTGSQLVGIFCCLMAMKFMEYNLDPSVVKHPVNHTIAVAISFMIVPIFDVFRVMFIRRILHRPIMLPDNHHIHYRLKALGLGAKWIDIILIGINCLVAAIAWYLAGYTDTSFSRMILIVFILLMALFHIPQALLTLRKRRQEKMQQTKENQAKEN